ncbi:MAG: thiamine-phosphate pyrophosphorylase [Acidobacteriota bacterium]|nr:thiamine-phosphate pyrophosphorylase [Acidobacteriota bacterium]
MVPPRFNLIAISDRRSLTLAPADWFRALGAAGIGAVQIREKDLEDGDLYRLTRLARETLPPDTKVFVNGRLDVALAAGADGVHLPADGLPAVPLRARFGRGVLIGRSTHSLAEVIRARNEEVDYVTFGPVYDTPGKGPPVGLQEFARAARLRVPVYAVGGVTLERFGKLALSGASGIAAIRLFQQVHDLNLVKREADDFFYRPSEARRADRGNR